jgi:hypothetical protein
MTCLEGTDPTKDSGRDVTVNAAVTTTQAGPC